MSVRAVVIDDSEDFRLILRRALTRAGIALVGEAGDGHSGVEVVRSRQPDVVILDVMMRGGDGLAVLPTLRRAAPATRVIIYSSLPVSVLEVLARGPDAIVEKAAGLQPLLAALKAVPDSNRDKVTPN